MDAKGTLQRHAPTLDDRSGAYGGVALSFANDPLILLYSDGTEEVIVGNQFGARLQAGYNFGGKARLDVEVPTYPSVVVRGVGGFAMGDVRLGALVPVWGGSDLGVGVTPFLTLPTGTEEAFVSTGGVGGGLVASVGGGSDTVRWVADVGMDLASKSTLGLTTTGSAVDIGVGASVRVADPVRVGLELDQRVSVTASEASGSSPMEAHAYATYGACEGFFATAGLGTAVIAGVGSPDFRAILALSWRKAACQAPDTDGDGVLDDVDRCVTAPEDMDGWQDDDGCPEDNDLDGVPDSEDACPMEPGLAAQNGCPDRDGDTVVDSADECPLQPGVPRFQGCPDSDNDGIPDATDPCPYQAGTGGGQGCPVVKVTQEAIVIIEKVHFELNGDRVLEQSYALLDAVAATLAAHPAIKKVEVQGHTDDLGPDEYNLNLSQRRAESVARYLIDRGVAAGRLDAKGYGESIPLVADTTEEARAANRRVEFRIIDQTL